MRTTIFSFLHALLDKPKLQWQLCRLKKLSQLPKHNILQHSSSLPPKYNKTEPIITLIKNPAIVIAIRFSVSSPLTKGCNNTKTIIATEIFKKVLPSSVATFFNPLIKLIITKCKRFSI